MHAKTGCSNLAWHNILTFIVISQIMWWDICFYNITYKKCVNLKINQKILSSKWCQFNLCSARKDTLNRLNEVVNWIWAYLLTNYPARDEGLFSVKILFILITKFKIKYLWLTKKITNRRIFFRYYFL